MNIIKKTICLILIAVLVAGTSACSDSAPEKTDKPNNSGNSSVNNPSSENFSSEVSSDSSTDESSNSKNNVTYITEYAPSVSRQEYTSNTKNNATNFIDKDGDFDYQTVSWSGPDGYVIVVPVGDTHAKDDAEYLSDYYKRVHNVTLQIVTDNTSAVSKEILIGSTNRSESKNNLKTGELEVAVSGEKLVFSGGHYVTVEAAVKRFTRLMPDKNQAFTFKLETDFSTTVNGLPGYVYTWGDEFEDWYDIDFGKWNFRLGMAGNSGMEVTYDRDVIDVSDGRLKLTPRYVFDPSNKELEFKVPYSVATDKTMNYVYGYAEIRARVPFYSGIWPSFWGGTACDLKAPRNPDWHAEIDVFENFGTTNTLKPNIHKWYDSTKYNGLFGYDATKRAHFQYPNRTPYVFKDKTNLSNEYHIYGYEWTPTEMNIYVDGKKYMTFDIVNSFDPLDDMSMFQDPQYHQFNCHVYSKADGSPPSLIYDNLGLLPACYYIDYFRLYQKEGSELYTDTSARNTVYKNRVKEIKLK